MFLFVATNCSFVVLGIICSISVKALFPSLLVSTLYGAIIPIWYDEAFRFAVITECLLLKLIKFIFAVSIWSASSWYWSGSCSVSCTFLLLTLLQTSLKLLTLLHSVFLTIGQALSGWMAGTTVTTALLHGWFAMCLLFLSVCPPPFHFLYLTIVFCLI